ncbi:calmodulin-binding protein 25-like [Rosa sericea]
MAASDNLAAMEPWAYRPTTTFADSWISEAFARDTKALTMALQKSLADNRSSESADSEFLPFFDTFQQETTATPTVSGVSGSDPESAAASKRQRNAVPVSAGKVAKRKSRASKRTQTTFITADPANFRQMVQQVTGVRFNGQQFSSVPTIVKPEPQRPGGNRLPGGGCLPTLDTSALLFDHHQQQQQQRQRQQYQQQVVEPASATGGGGQMGPMRYGATVEVAEGGGGVSGGGLGFDSYSSFPTLESWKVM